MSADLRRREITLLTSACPLILENNQAELPVNAVWVHNWNFKPAMEEKPMSSDVFGGKGWLAASALMVVLSGCSTTDTAEGDRVSAAMAAAEAAMAEAKAARAGADAALVKARAAEDAAQQALAASEAGTEARALAEKALTTASVAKDAAASALAKADETQSSLQRVDKKADRMFRKSQAK
jgi:hypothetical protein